MQANKWWLLLVFWTAQGAPVEVDGTRYTLIVPDGAGDGTAVSAKMLHCRIGQEVFGINAAVLWTPQGIAQVERAAAGQVRVVLASGAKLTVQVVSDHPSAVQVQRISSPGLIGPERALNGLAFLSGPPAT